MEKTGVVKLYNTISRKKEVFRPICKDRVGLYTCGPTVYNFVHIGNLRTYIFEDILRRTLEYAGYNVKHIMNITDVDDKTIASARKAGKTLQEFTLQYEDAFKNDLKSLNIEFPERFTRATEYIPKMLKTIGLLLKKKFAYEKDGSVYFAVSKFKNYGKLARIRKKGLKAGTRIDADEYAKEEVQDFALWKTTKAGEPSWASPFGKGRPGWHIECSVMSLDNLGQPFDIHAGGVDLIFPHHENEIAQSEAAYGKKFVKYWLHGEHLLVDGKKMAKSLGNVFTLQDIKSWGSDAFAFRYLILGADYRSKLNFTRESLAAAQKSLMRLQNVTDALRSMPPAPGKTKTGSHELDMAAKKFTDAVFNDLNTPQGLAVIWDIIRKYRKSPEKFQSEEILGFLFDADRVLGLNLKDLKAEKIPEDILTLMRERESLRREKKWQEADALRGKIQDLGYGHAIKDVKI